MKLQTSPLRVYLRPPVPADSAEYTALARKSIRMHNGLVKPPRTAAQFTTYLTRAALESNSFWIVSRNEDKAILGTINFSQIFHGQLKSAYMGYHVFSPFANQGYMTEGMGLALRIAFGKLKLHRVEANIQPGNTASIKLVKRWGFRKEGFSPKYVKVGGRWRDHERWAMLQDERPR